MKIIVDTREQKPLEFPFEFVTGTIIAKLSVGDYSCQFEDGYTPPVSFERKSVSDLFGTMGRGYKRFKQEIERAKSRDIRLILIIEDMFSKVEKGLDRSELAGETVIRKLMTLWVKHNIYPVFCKNRDECAKFIYEFFCSIGRLKGKRMKDSEFDYAKLQVIRGERDI